MSEAEIARLRDEIADIDKEILDLVAKRLHLAEQVGLENHSWAVPPGPIRATTSSSRAS